MQPGPDSGAPDAGSDRGGDAGPDGGGDAGTDGGGDAGTPGGGDAGTDGGGRDGGDAGPIDAGPWDAGPLYQEPHAELDGGALFVDGQATFLYGGDLHYFRVRDPNLDAAATRAMWDQSLDLKVAAGMNLMTTYAPPMPARPRPSCERAGRAHGSHRIRLSFGVHQGGASPAAWALSPQRARGPSPPKRPDVAPFRTLPPDT